MDKTFVHNGLHYREEDDVVLYQIVNEHGDYLGINFSKDNKTGGFNFNDIYKTNKESGFIFMLDKKMFDNGLFLTPLLSPEFDNLRAKFGKFLSAKIYKR